MSRYHINPETGVPGACKATVACPFGDINTDHYATKEEAREAYEASQAGNTFGKARKASTLPLPAYPAYLTPELIAKIPRAADGTTFEENWAARFEVLTHANYDSVESYLRKQMGNPDFGRPRGSLEAVWLVPGEFDRYEENPAHPNESAGVYPYEAKPEGGILMAQIYTRNGGGNRECWCNDKDHSEGKCTAAITDDLEAREDFYESWDDDFDSTYATFMFRVDESPELDRIGSEDVLQRRQANLKASAEAIQRGDLSPLTVMPVHKPHKDRLDKLQTERRTLDRKWADEDKKFDPHGYNSLHRFDAKQRTDAARILARPVSSWTKEDAKTLSVFTRQNEKMAWDRIKAAQEEQAKVDAYEEALSEVRAGSVPAGTLALLGGEKKIQEDLRYRIKLRDNRLADYQKLQKRLKLRERYDSRREKLDSQIETLEGALHWPGRVSNMPAELLSHS